ncbi:MAG: T9SS C-terminal target domain-containing protein [Ignavibacteriales bacterium]|nr:MAG: T9SS C-terminal target domain-containing protein [Ignavibacteriales bacterium]
MKTKLLYLFIFFSAFASVVYSQQAKWTIMVYLDGDNNLEGAGIADVNEMEMIGSTSDVNVLVQFDRVPGEDATNGDWTDTRRFRITKDNDQQNISSAVLQNLGEINMGSPQSLIDFVNWSVSNYPAQNYCLVLWDHGGGWKALKGNKSGLKKINVPGLNHVGSISDIVGRGIPDGVKEPNFTNPFSSGFGITKDVCYDDTDGDYLSSDEIGKVLNVLGVRINILGYDACLMAMIENAYEVRNKVDFMVASEETEPGEGWPYNTFLNQLVNNANMSAATLSSVIVSAYQNYYTNYSDKTQTLSALDMSKLSDVIVKIDQLSEELINVKPWTVLGNIYMNIDYFYNRTSLDLFDFADRLSNAAGNANLVTKANNLKQSINEFVISNFTEEGHPGAKGIAIYFPLKSDFNPKYSNNLLNIDFPMDIKWDDFLLSYFNEGENTTIYDPYEPNDEFVQAYGPVNSGFTYKGYIQDKNDFDIYKFTTGSDFNINISLNVPADLDLLLVVKEGDSYYKVDSSYSYGNTNEYISRTNQPAGEYYIIVMPYEVSNSEYELTSDIVGGEGLINLELSYDDGVPDYGLYSTATDFAEGIACLFRLPAAPAKLKGFWFYLYSLDVIPGDGNDGSFWVAGSDYYGSFIPNDYLYYTPGNIGWNYVDLSLYDVTLNSDFFAGMFSDRYNTPAIGWDTTSSNGLNLIYTNLDGYIDWHVSEGTFFIRAVVSVYNNTTGIEETVTLAPGTYSLDNAYPNPFNPSTTISYSIPEEAKVNIEIYDMLGRRVTTLFDGVKTAGKYQTTWNAENCASGIYFYKVSTKNFTQTKKLLLMK